jgi:hypothetical protein
VIRILAVVSSWLAISLIASTTLAGDPICPAHVRSMPIHGPAAIQAIDSDGELAVTWDDIGLTVWDVRDPAAIRPLGSYDYRRLWTPDFGEPPDLYLHSDGWALVLPWLDAFDLRQPSRPEPRPIASWLEIKHRARGPNPWQQAAAHDRFLALYQGWSDICLLDLEDPFDGEWFCPVWPGLDDLEHFVFADDRLLTLSYSGELRLYDLTTSANPVLTGGAALPLPSTAAWSLVGGDGDVALAVSRINQWGTYPVEIWSIDLADPANPVVHDLTGLFQWPFVRDVWFSGRTAVAFVWDDSFPTDTYRLVELDLTDPQNPVVSWTRPMRLEDAALSPLGVVAAHSDRLELVERSSGFPTLGASPVEGVAVDLAVDGVLGITAAKTDGIRTLDLTDPLQPTITGSLDLAGEVRMVRLNGTNAIALAVDVHDWSLVTIDVGDPSAPSVQASLPVRPNTRDLAWEGDLIALGIPSSSSEGLVDIVDVSNPSAPTLRSTFGTGIMSSSEMRVRLSGSTAIVGSLDAVISVDLGDPDNPVELDRIDTDGFEVTALELIGDRAYVLVAGFIYAIDIADPASLGEPTAAGGQWADLGAPGAGWLAYTFGQNAPSFLGDHSSLASPVVHRAPEESRWWHPGVVVGDTLLRPSGPFLDIASFECRPPIADFRWAGLGLEIDFVDLSAYCDNGKIWWFGDGIGLSTSGVSARHEYTEPGRYDVTLTAWSSQGSDTVVTTIEVGTRVFWDGFETGDLVAWDEPGP